MNYMKEFFSKPITKDVDENSPQELLKPKRPEAKANRKCVLVLDDDPTFGELLMRYRNKYNVDVEAFENVHQFVQRLTEETFDVVILDYYLEGYVGTQLASLIQGTPVILVSNKNNWQESDSSMLAPGSRFIHKKAGPDKILAEAVSLIRR